MMRASILRAQCAVALAVGMTACSLAPEYVRPELPVAAQWRDGGMSGVALPEDGGHEEGWRSVFSDPLLQGLIEESLEHNRDLRVAVLRISEARARHGLQRAEQLPTLTAQATLERQRLPAAGMAGMSSIGENVQAGVSFAGYELDLWGRLRSLSQAAREQLLETTEAARGVRIGLISEVALAYLELLAANDLVAHAQAMRDDTGSALILVERGHVHGVASELELRQARSAALSSTAELESMQRRRSLAVNKLEMLIGRPLEPQDISTAGLKDTAIAMGVPAGLSSELLLERPDIMAAEARLRATHANIGAARAAFLPRITLTGQGGYTSSELSGLLDGTNRGWSFSPGVDVPIFDIGRRLNQLKVTRVQQEVAVAEYEKSLQQAFREVADTLVSRKSLDAQVDIQEELVHVEARRVEISKALHREGLSSYLEVLDATRSLSSASTALVNARMEHLANMVLLYKNLGGAGTGGHGKSGEGQASWCRECE